MKPLTHDTLLSISSKLEDIDSWEIKEKLTRIRTAPTAHTVSQRLRRIKDVPAELWPLGEQQSPSIIPLVM